MAAQWIWLSGFATNLGVWEDDLIEIESDADHTFISYTQVIENPNDLYTSIAGLLKADVVVASDVAALALIQSLEKRPQGQKWILLAPIVNFCEGEDGWPKNQVLLMAKAMQKNTKAALAEFEELLGPCDESIQEEWLDSALHMPPASLAKGLDFLANTVTEDPIRLENTEVIFGREDLLVTPQFAKYVTTMLPGTRVQERLKSGHWVHTLLL
jgi:hypothetical protein